MKKVFLAAAVLAVAACTASEPNANDEPVAQSESAAKTCKPERKYVSRDPNQCAAILFLCEEGREPFFDNRGCGCKCGTPANVCDDPNRTYVSRDPNQCMVVRFMCEEGQSYFSDACGCGCTF